MLAKDGYTAVAIIALLIAGALLALKHPLAEALVFTSITVGLLGRGSK